MKKTLPILLIIFCCTSYEIANEVEKQWCIDTFWKLYGEIPVEWEEGERELTFSFHDSISTFENENRTELDPALFRMKLLDNDIDYMKVCKIWFDIESSEKLEED